MPNATTKRIQDAINNPRPPSRLMRVPLETYDLIAKWADTHRRHMNQQLAVIVQEWDDAETLKEMKREKAREAREAREQKAS